MRSKLAAGLAVGIVGFLVVTNPVVGEAAGQITGKQIKNGSVTGKDIKNHSITSKDVSGSIAGPTGPQGPVGPQGPQGAQGLAGSARAYGFVDIDSSGNFVLRAGSKGVVAVGQGGGGNPAACIQLDPSIDASKAIVVATANLRSGSGSAFNTQVEVVSPLGYCGGILPNEVEVVTSQTNSPGAAVKGAFAFAVM